MSPLNLTVTRGERVIATHTIGEGERVTKRIGKNDSKLDASNLCDDPYPDDLYKVSVEDRDGEMPLETVYISSDRPSAHFYNGGDKINLKHVPPSEER
jgi:hypothetical protein